MVQQKTGILNGIVLEDEVVMTLHELCDVCAVHAGFIAELVDEGVLEPAGVENSQWCFTGVSLHRVRTAKRLHQDLGVNLAGVALALELLDEVRLLRARLDRMAES
ncbi:MAG: MerR family transcriptional regulator [Gammaproteobacteria bacterium]|nr:MAG: MerR family transcriptional regulator [Gammaproteobacteria bacterium]